VLRPLDSLTRSIEELAETTDVSRRLDPGGPDELGRLRRAFNRLLVALDTSRESQRQLVLDASHELRTPLTSLRTNMEVARRLDELPPEERDVLINDVLTQMDELTSLVGDMAELARGDRPALTTGPFRLDQVVLEAVDAATTHGRSRGVTFDARVAPTWVSGSTPRIERAVDNLLDNALKWSPDGGVVEVACSNGTLIVRDHGPGVADSDAEFIFDRFYRAPGARGRPGSGLGLAIVAQVARDEGGTVNVYRAEGGGALFRFSLPEIPPPPEMLEAGGGGD
jgi:two-component system sensor histidine kinase MprB